MINIFLLQLIEVSVEKKIDREQSLVRNENFKLKKKMKLGKPQRALIFIILVSCGRLSDYIPVLINRRVENVLRSSRTITNRFR